MDPTVKTSNNNACATTNPLVTALLTDLYQITMAYAHWKTGKARDPCVFELFFRKNPFRGEYTVFCGLGECLEFLRDFRFSSDDLRYLRSNPALSMCEDEFFSEYLANLHRDLESSAKLYAVPEGTVVFPRCPLVIFEGPLGIGHIVETTLLNLINFPSLVATNASRMVLRAGPHKSCIEFGLRRAQGPDGACTASKYSYAGGFVATSNVLAGKRFGIPIAGTHAHSFVQSFSSLDEISGLTLFHKGSQTDRVFLDTVLEHRQAAAAAPPETTTKTNDGELAAFCAYACAFPNSCLCLIDTYDTLASGLPNFVFVAKALGDFGYSAIGVRLDSGDLAELSKACHVAFRSVRNQEPSRAGVFDNLTIVVSNDIDEAALVELAAGTGNSNDEDQERRDDGPTAFGIGTNLVTCKDQPALGCVYKLVEYNGEPRIKLSEELVKVTLPGRKRVYRLYGGPNHQTPLVDYLALADEEPPCAIVGSVSDRKAEAAARRGVLCRHPFRHQHRIRVFPSRVQELHGLVFGSSSSNNSTRLSETRDYVLKQLSDEFPESVTRYESPIPYDVMVSEKLYTYLHELWETHAPVPERR